MERFRIHVADEVIDDLRVRLRRTRWPDQVPGISWKQGTELEWLRRLVSYWADEFDWRAWERKLNGLDHFIWEGIHFVYRRAASGRGVPLIVTHGWPSSFLDYVDMLPMLEDFDVVVPSLLGYGFSPRPLEAGINYRYVSECWHRLMTALGYSRYAAGGNDFGSGVTTFLALDHPESVIGIHLTTLESDLTPSVDDAELSDAERSFLVIRLHRISFLGTCRALRSPLFHLCQELGLRQRNRSAAFPWIPAPEHQRSAHMFHNLVDTAIAILLGIFEQFT